MPELTVRCAEIVQRPREAVWAFVADRYFTHHPRWDHDVTAMEQLTPGPVGKGTRGAETRSFGGTQRAEFEVTEFDPPARFAFRNTTGPFELTRSYDLTDAGGATRLEFTFRMAPRGAMVLLFPLVRGTVAKKVRANIARIPGLVATS